MTEGFPKQRIGDEQNLVKQALREIKSMEEFLKGVWTAEPVIVTGYDFANQRVDLKLMNYPNSYREIEDIPIYNTSGSLQLFQKYKTTDNPKLTEGDIGILLFSRTESKNSWDDKKLRGDHPPLYHEGEGGIFIPGPITRNEDPPSILNADATATDLDDLGPNDAALVHESGSFILFKENGEVVIKGKEVYFGDKEDNVASFKNVARDGDNVNNPNAQDGTIEASAVTIKAGD